MSWIAISDGRRAIVSPGAATAAMPALLSIGTLVVEVRFVAEGDTRQTIIDLNRTQFWPRKFRVTLGEKGDVFVEHRQGNTITNAAVRIPEPDRDATLRITMSWHAPQRVGLLTVEDLDSGSLSQSVIEEPHPWPLDDVEALVRRDGCTIDGSTTLLAVSDGVEPVGMRAGFATETLIDTFAGPRPVKELRPGDLVQTSEHGMQPIRGIALHDVPALGRFAPVDLRAPFFGLERDLTVAPDHRLLVTGVDAEYLFGSDAVLVEARHLAKMAAHPRKNPPKTIRYAQVLLDAHVCLSSGGAWGESMFIGNLADHPARLATSVLAGNLPRDLPRHTRIANPQLKSYEAMVLVSALCA